jgi:hypothetical protein
MYLDFPDRRVDAIQDRLPVVIAQLVVQRPLCRFRQKRVCLPSPADRATCAFVRLRMKGQGLGQECALRIIGCAGAFPNSNTAAPSIPVQEFEQAPQLPR